MFRGADSGSVEGSAEPISFERSLSLDDARDSEALLAYAMNGEPLPVQHGYPLRLVVPGWYAVASVKWLTEIEVDRHRRSTAFFQTERYVYEWQRDGETVTEPVRLQQVRSVITEPTGDDDVAAGELVDPRRRLVGRGTDRRRRRERRRRTLAAGAADRRTPPPQLAVVGAAHPTRRARPDDAARPCDRPRRPHATRAARVEPARLRRQRHPDDFHPRPLSGDSSQQITGLKTLKIAANLPMCEVMQQTIRRWLGVVVLLIAPTLFLVFLRTFPGFDARWFSASGHMVVVSAIAACALFVAAVAVVSATQTPQSGVVWLALGCSIVGLFMVGHGLSTPGAIHHHDFNMWVGRLPYIALAGFAVCLLVAGRPQDRGVNRWVGRHPLIAVLTPIVPATAFVAAVVDDPSRFHGATQFANENTWLAILSTAIIACLLVAILRHGRRWHLGKDPVQLALVLAATMSVAAVVSFEHGKFAQLSWWDYHAYLFAGFAAAAYAVIVRGRRQSAVYRRARRRVRGRPVRAHRPRLSRGTVDLGEGGGGQRLLYPWPQLADCRTGG